MNDYNQFDESSLLFATPSFLRGIARIVAPYGRVVSYAYSSSDKIADARAIGSDWRAVGRDLLGAMVRFQHETTEMR